MRPLSTSDGELAPLLARACKAVVGTVVGALAVATLILPLVAHAGSPEDDAGATRRVVEAATAVLRTHLAARSETFRIDARSLPAGTVLPEGGAVLVARPLSESIAVEPRMRVWVDLRAPAAEGGRFVRSVAVAFDVAATARGWVATRDLAAGAPVAEALHGGAIVPAGIDVAALRVAPAATWPDGARLRRALRAGETLAASHVESAPAVARGDTVSLRVRTGAIGVEARAEALQDGARGAAVWVRVAQATAPIRARVVDVATVEIAP